LGGLEGQHTYGGLEGQHTYCSNSGRHLSRPPIFPGSMKRPTPLGLDGSVVLPGGLRRLSFQSF
jgi:hypothetical protein